MFTEYMKTLIQNGGGKFNVIKIEAQTEEGIQLKRDEYMSNDYQVATQEEYDAQVKEAADREEAAKDDKGTGQQEETNINKSGELTEAQKEEQEAKRESADEEAGR